MVFFSMVIVALPVRGMVYVWKDVSGVVHYSNKEYDVPLRYKGKVKAIYPEASDTASSASATSSGQVAQPAPGPPATTPQAEGGLAPKQQVTPPAAQPPQRGEDRRRRVRGPRVSGATEE